MTVFLCLLGMVGAFFIIKYREILGDLIGEAAWMRSVGGVYNVMILFGIFVFFWSLAVLTGTTDVLFGAVRYLFPGGGQPPAATGI